MDTVVLAAQVVLAVIFATAGVGKLLDLEGSRRAVQDFGVPAGIAPAFGVLLPLAELAVAAGLVFRPSAQVAAAAGALLLLAFMAGIANALRHGVQPDCHCFGQIHSAPAGPGTLIRNGLLAALALVVAVQGPGIAIDTWVADRTGAELAAVALGSAAVVVGLFAFQLWTEVRQLRRDVAAASKMAAAAPPGLPVGAQAPGFELESVTGGTVSLDEMLARGNPVLLVFTSPFCGSCAEVFPNLRRWQQTLSERLTIALISQGSTEDNRPTIDEHGLERVLLQKQSEVVEAYRIRGTPSAVLITSDGTIGALPAESVFAIEPLVRLVLRGGEMAAVPQGSAA